MTVGRGDVPLTWTWPMTAQAPAGSTKVATNVTASNPACRARDRAIVASVAARSVRDRGAARPDAPPCAASRAAALFRERLFDVISARAERGIRRDSVLE